MSITSTDTTNTEGMIRTFYVKFAENDIKTAIDEKKLEMIKAEVRKIVDRDIKPIIKRELRDIEITIKKKIIDILEK